MAETATAPAPAADKQAHTRPTKPDENAFKEALAKAEKDHKVSMDHLVRLQSPPSSSNGYTYQPRFHTSGLMCWPRGLHRLTLYSL